MLTFFALVGACKDRRGRLVEWVEKASFVHLNNLFEITTNERNHQTLLTARNLLVGIREPQPYVLPIILRRLPMVMVHGEHFVLKDLPFYEEAHEVNAKARQEHLDQREEKRQERKLRRAPSKKGRASLSATCPLVKKKKKPSAKAIKVLAPVFASPSVSTPSAFSLADSSV